MKRFGIYTKIFYSNNYVHVETISTFKSSMKNVLISLTDIKVFGSYKQNQRKHLKIYFSTGKFAESSNNITIH